MSDHIFGCHYLPSYISGVGHSLLINSLLWPSCSPDTHQVRQKDAVFHNKGARKET